jgi:hypothetical protein
MVLAKVRDSTFEIDDVDDLLRIVKEARSRHEPLIIQDSGTEIVVRASQRPRRRSEVKQTRAEDDVFLASAGSLAGLFDPEEFTNRYRTARGSRRPPLMLDFSEE